MEISKEVLRRLKNKVKDYPEDEGVSGSLKEMNIDVATKVMGWKVDRELNEYYFIFNRERYKICNVNEFDPVFNSSDAIEVLELCGREYRIEVHNEVSEDAPRVYWDCKVVDGETHYTGNHELMGFALCEALLKMKGVNY